MGNQIKIGLIIDSYTLKLSEFNMIKRILDSHYAKIEVIYFNPVNKEKKITKFFDGSQIIFSLLLKVDNLFLKTKNNALNLVDIDDLFSEIPYTIILQKNEFPHQRTFHKECESVSDHELDVLIDLSEKPLADKLFQAPKLGIWKICYGDSTRFKGGPSGFWEVIECYPVTGSELQIQLPNFSLPVSISKSYSTTAKMIHRNQNHYYWKTSMLVTRKLEEIYKNGDSLFLSQLMQDLCSPNFYCQKRYEIPHNTEALIAMVKLFCSIVKTIILKILYRNQWILLFNFGNTSVLDLFRFKKIIPPKGRDWADPFAIYKDGKYFIFIEELIHRTEKGHISVIQINENGIISDPIIVIDKPYHMSYPFIFVYMNEYFMIPETSANNSIELYKCNGFPYKWEFQKNLMNNIKCGDTTLLFHNHIWWLFTSISEIEGISRDDELFLFYSHDFTSGEWKSHPLNPIISDVRKARSAGKIFKKGDRLFRPAQNSSFIYGWGIVINEIIILNETDYQEREVSSIEPKWDKRIIGTHTFCQTEDLTIIDGQFMRIKCNFRD